MTFTMKNFCLFRSCAGACRLPRATPYKSPSARQETARIRGIPETDDLGTNAPRAHAPPGRGAARMAAETTIRSTREYGQKAGNFQRGGLRPRAHAPQERGHRQLACVRRHLSGSRTLFPYPIPCTDLAPSSRARLASFPNGHRQELGPNGAPSPNFRRGARWTLALRPGDESRSLIGLYADGVDPKPGSSAPGIILKTAQIVQPNKLACDASRVVTAGGSSGAGGGQHSSRGAILARSATHDSVHDR